MQVKLIKTDGEKSVVSIKTFDQARSLVSHFGYKSPVELIPLENGDYLVIDEEGKLKNLPLNWVATNMCHDSESIFPSDFICGDVLLVQDIDEFDNLPFE